jgi:hypothetical protein
MKQLPYLKTSDSIAGYSDSKLAKYENSDCVVRAIAAAFGMSYDDSHSLVASLFDRKSRKGTLGFIPKMKILSQKMEINGKKFGFLDTSVISTRKIGSLGSISYPKQTTVNQFVKKYPKGTFIIVVRQHAFCIKDGFVIGNTEDSLQLKKRIVSVFKIGSK